MRKTFLHIALLLLGLPFFANSYADESQMNETLVQMVNQLNAMLPLIDKAEKEQSPKSATQFHFESFKDVDGLTHPGLRQDVLAIRQGVMAQINQAPVEPRTVTPIEGDYQERQG